MRLQSKRISSATARRARAFANAAPIAAKTDRMKSNLKLARHAAHRPSAFALLLGMVFHLGAAVAADDALPSGQVEFADEFANAPAAPEEAPEPSFWSTFTWSGYLKNETAYRYHEPRSITKSRNIAYLSVQKNVNEKINFNFSGWTYYDLAYDMFNYDTIAGRDSRDAEEPLIFRERLQEQKDSNMADVRELYFDLTLDGLDLRVGKQYIIWGVLEGVRVVDELNPMDFRELILADLLDYRISLWSIKSDFFLEDGNIQLVFIPDVKFHKAAPRGSEWELLQDVCIDQPEEIICQQRKPSSWRLKDSEYGIRYETTVKDIEWSLSYLYTWDDFPVIFRAVPTQAELICREGDEDNLPNCVYPAFFPTATRLHMYGTTAVRQFGRYILKGEVAYVTGKFFGIRNTTDFDNNKFVDHDGALMRDHFRWALGIEFNIGGFDIAPGITQWVINNHEPMFLQDRYDSTLTLFVRKEMPQQAAVFQMLVIDLVNMRELLVKPKVTFQIDDRFQLGAGVDLFFGLKSDFGNRTTASGATSFDPGVARAQFIGNFHDNDRVYLEFKYSF